MTEVDELATTLASLSAAFDALGVVVELRRAQDLDDVAPPLGGLAAHSKPGASGRRRIPSLTCHRGWRCRRAPSWWSL
jgi:hypothetical protein